jgi:hypothetical protein
MSLVVTIFSAVQLEAKAMARAIQAPVPTPVLPVHSTFENLKIVHHLIGMRAVGLPKARVDPDTRYIILAGVAGALDPGLAVGDLVLCDCPGELGARLEIGRGTVHTAMDLVSTPGQKAALFASTGAGVVDMETSAVREFAEKGGWPFVSVRAVSDSAGQWLDPGLVRLVDPWGRVRAGEVAAYVVGNPFRILTLMKVGREAGRAARRLGEGVVEVLRAVGRE